jgi:hypothetical protein
MSASVGVILQLLMEYELNGNRLGRETLQSEAPLLAENLRARLQTPAGQLDLSPRSLRTLEREILNYVQTLSATSTPITSWPEQSILGFVRELAAYIGLTLLNSLAGAWESNLGLMGPLFTIEGPIKVVDGHHSYLSRYGMSFPLGNVAANGLDVALAGQAPGFYSVYQRAKRKVSSQKL